MSKLHCICGKDYWRAQQWMHESCVVNAPINAVVNKLKNPDRHKDKEARRKYMAEYMRKRRAG